MRLMTQDRVAIAGAQKNSGLAVTVPQHERRAMSLLFHPGAILVALLSMSHRPISIAAMPGMREYAAPVARRP
jgi:hypothetical protein